MCSSWRLHGGNTVQIWSKVMALQHEKTSMETCGDLSREQRTHMCYLHKPSRKWLEDMSRLRSLQDLHTDDHRSLDGRLNEISSL